MSTTTPSRRAFPSTSRATLKPQFDDDSRSSRKTEEADRKAQDALLATLTLCMDQTRKADMANAELMRRCRKAEMDSDHAKAELRQAQEVIVRAETAEADQQKSNFKLQAKILNLERSKTNGDEGGGDVEKLMKELDHERKARTELESHYAALQNYYEELLLYVNETEKEKSEMF